MSAAAAPRYHLPVALAMESMGASSSCQSAATSEIVKHCWLYDARSSRQKTQLLLGDRATRKHANDS